MKIYKKISFFIVIIFIITSCASSKIPKYATITNKPDLSTYKYVYITPSTERTSVVGGAIGNQYGVCGFTTSTGINPSDMISGSFIKNGFIKTS